MSGYWLLVGTYFGETPLADAIKSTFKHHIFCEPNEAKRIEKYKINYHSMLQQKLLKDLNLTEVSNPFRFHFSGSSQMN